MKKLIETYLGVFVSLVNFIIIAIIFLYEFSTPSTDFPLYLNQKLSDVKYNFRIKNNDKENFIFSYKINKTLIT